MKNPLDSIKGTIIAGVVLMFVIIAILDSGEPGLMSDANNIYLGFMRWFHAIAGIAWIGLLYYFNFVQVPALKDAAADGSCWRNYKTCRASCIAMVQMGCFSYLASRRGFIRC